MPFLPKKRTGQRLATDVRGVAVDRAFIAHFQVEAADAVAADVDAVHAAVVDTGVQQVITTGFTAPAVPRNITATAGGTAGDIKAIQVIVEGTNYADEEITETLPAFTVDTAGTVQGTKAFKTVTSWTVPPHDGTGATTSLGFGNELGLPFRMAHETVLAAYLDGELEETPAFVSADGANLESNTVRLNSALDGSSVDVYLIV